MTGHTKTATRKIPIWAKMKTAQPLHLGENTQTEHYHPRAVES